MVTHGPSVAGCSSTSGTSAGATCGAVIVPIVPRPPSLDPDRTLVDVNPALLTDHYELTMVGAALADGTADRRCVFEAFARRLPPGRRYGVVAGTGRLVELLREFRFDPQQVDYLRSAGVASDRLAEWLARYRVPRRRSRHPRGGL